MIINIILLLVIIGCIWFGTRQITQNGGEYVAYWQLGPENSRRLYPQGFLSSDGFVPPELSIDVTRHTNPSRAHSHNSVDTSGHENRCPTGNYYLYRDTFDWKPYDWRPFDWRPYWQRRADLCPSARTCSEFASDNCIGTGTSDYQSCYDVNFRTCQRLPSKLI